MNKTDVVIPARNEERTLAPIIVVLKHHPAIGNVIVCVDSDTTDLTYSVAEVAGANYVLTGTEYRGKGQCVNYGLDWVRTERVMFCDADLHNLTAHHIDLLTLYMSDASIVGVPDFPPYPELQGNAGLEIMSAWPWVSGERTMVTKIAQEARPLHGYLMEVQLNQATMDAGLDTDLRRLNGLISPFRMSDRRKSERHRDWRYGVDHGILPH